ncbi:MerR family transcriptional regulator [Bacillus massilinigeriensis]|uniref:MerR family transcriptional regulator n=1 Tax=Bacillus massilionigeriensis TaxID=1805475 RepID=UPI00096B5D26|nr:MerR family transcriptional regulator [Bacillus massilionigeriensis]
MADSSSYKDKKVITIGTVCELTGLSERKIRYYEERQLIFPERTNGKTRKYSFSDIETLMNIAEMLEDGFQTYEIRQEMKKKKQKLDENAARKEMIQGQINARFGIQKRP